jgi:hypothetical protein
MVRMNFHAEHVSGFIKCRYRESHEESRIIEEDKRTGEFGPSIKKPRACMTRFLVTEVRPETCERLSAAN